MYCCLISLSINTNFIFKSEHVSGGEFRGLGKVETQQLQEACKTWLCCLLQSLSSEVVLNSEKQGHLLGEEMEKMMVQFGFCLLYTSPSPRD